MPLLLTPQSTLGGYFEMSKVIHLTTCFKWIYDFRLHPPAAHSVSSLPPPLRYALPPLNSFQPSVVDSYGTQSTLMCSKIIMYVFAFLSKNVSFSETKTLPVSTQGYLRRWSRNGYWLNSPLESESQSFPSKLLSKAHCWILKKLNTELPFAPAIPPLGIYPKNSKQALKDIFAHACSFHHYS